MLRFRKQLAKVDSKLDVNSRLRGQSHLTTFSSTTYVTGRLNPCVSLRKGWENDRIVGEQLMPCHYLEKSHQLSQILRSGSVRSTIQNTYFCSYLQALFIHQDCQKLALKYDECHLLVNKAPKIMCFKNSSAFKELMTEISSFLWQTTSTRRRTPGSTH